LREYQGDAAVHGPCVSCLHEVCLTGPETGCEEIIQDSRRCHNDSLTGPSVGWNDGGGEQGEDGAGSSATRARMAGSAGNGRPDPVCHLAHELDAAPWSKPRACFPALFFDVEHAIDPVRTRSPDFRPANQRDAIRWSGGRGPGDHHRSACAQSSAYSTPLCGGGRRMACLPKMWINAPKGGAPG